MKVRLLPEAERDLELGADFYETQQRGLGAYFTDCQHGPLGAGWRAGLRAAARCATIGHYPAYTAHSAQPLAADASMAYG